MTKVFPGTKGGLHGTPLRKPLSLRNFAITTTMYIYTLKTTIFKQKKKKYTPQKFTISKWHPNDQFLFWFISILIGKNLKNLFSKRIFNEIWLIIGDHEYINIAEIKIATIFIPVEFGGSSKHFFLHLQNANLC